MPPMFVLLIFGLLLVCGMYVLGMMHFIWRQFRQFKREQQSIEWQFEKMQRFHAGWRPSLWDEGASDEEKLTALEKYLRGEM